RPAHVYLSVVARSRRRCQDRRHVAVRRSDGVRAGEARDPLTLCWLSTGGSAQLTLAALCVFCGAVAKSAQFPLHPWLPDAMQGPTTASSLIHAATMVAAGVFLVARAYPLFTPEALAVVGWTGGVTCLLAAAVAG